MLRVGLTGGLASGKSTVLEVFRSCGAATLDADLVVRELLLPPSPLLGRLVDLLGPEALAARGGLDRSRVAALVFARPELRRRLEALLHPEVMREEERRAAELAAAGAAMLIVDAALLIEAGRLERFHRLVVVSCPPEVQLARAVSRGMSEADARARMAAQLPAADKAARADYVIDSSGSLAGTRARAREVHGRLEEDARRLRAGRLEPSRAHATGS